MLRLAGEGEPVPAFLKGAVQALLASLRPSYVALVAAEQGRWRPLAEAGLPQALPEQLLADCLDREQTVADGDWSAVPLAPQRGTGEVLVVCRDPEHGSPVSADSLERAANCVTDALSLVRMRDRHQRRVARLESLLQITSRWSQFQTTDELLHQIAEAATRLLAAERASIFLWDRTTHTLVGRPALGVDDGGLRVPDDAGVVGQVVQTGQSRRVAADQSQGEVDRSVDDQLGFHTRNLLCVPLRSPQGKRFGAFEVINRKLGDFTAEDEFALSELADQAAIAIENTQQYERLLRTRNQLTEQAAAGVELIGECSSIDALRSTVARIADTDLAILILGENGTGKEVVCQLIHYLSQRRSQPLVAVNCAAISETLLESELFGHERGAFTDAREARVGKFELASGGTLFLDEIGDLSPGGQAKLLRVLEEKTVVRVGGSTPIATDARVIAATNQNLGKMVREKRFREDLFFRLNVVTLDLPPLRERGEDILLLAEHFLKEFSVKARRQPPGFTAATRRRLLTHNWPGNIRELRNLMERLAYLFQGDQIDAEDLDFTLPPEAPAPTVLSLDLPLTDATRRFQAEYITRQVQAADGNMTEAARRLGLHRSNLYRKMRHLGMTPDEEES
jgi:transcriptional regulator with GAF, ATPase, and Fis domain